MTHDEMIAVILAHKAGKAIQCRDNHPACRNWYSVAFPAWNFEKIEYRIKPEPREVWIDVVPQSGMQDAYTGVSTGPRPGWTKFREVIE